MTATTSTTDRDQRERVFADLTRRADDLYRADSADVVDFARRVFEHVATEDLVEREPRDLLGAVTALQDFARVRPPGETLVAVFSPTLRENNWTSRRSVVLICTDDAPFLVDSVTTALERIDQSISLLVHPLLVVERSADGTLVDIVDARPSADRSGTESWMLLEVDRLPNARAEQELGDLIAQVLADVRVAVNDWSSMRQVCQDIVDGLGRDVPATVPQDHVDPAREFLQWLTDDHFTFVGYREYVLDDVDIDGTTEVVLRPVPDSGLGILRAKGQDFSRLRPEAQAGAREPQLLTITKSNSRSTVHRNVYLDYIGIRTFDDAGTVVGEKRFLGLFTSAAYAESVTRLPIVAAKVQAVLDRSGYSPDSHSGKDLLQILEGYPRDELFSTDVEQLAQVAQRVQHSAGRRRPMVFARKDEFGRFASALVYVPRDRYTTAVRQRIENVLRESYAAEHVDFTVRLSDSPLAQLHFVLRAGTGQSVPDVDMDQLGQNVLQAIRTWDEQLSDLVHTASTGASDQQRTATAATEQAVEAEERANRLLSLVTFSEAYKEDISPAAAVDDLKRLAALLATGVETVHLAPGANGEERRFKVYAARTLSLTTVLPTLTDLGVEVVDERPYSVEVADDPLTTDVNESTDLHVYDFGLRAPAEVWDDDATLFEQAFSAVWNGEAESDALNSLVLGADLTWRQVVILRAIGRYLRQIGSTFSMEYIEEALVANPQLSAGIVRLFETRFDPDDDVDDTQRAADAQAQVESLTAALDEVASLDADRILRAFIGIVGATLRTNYFQTEADGVTPKPYVSMKLDCRSVPGLPAPQPMAEIWVYAPSVEGVHLRFGPVARGGLRWSDRREDFRTEVLGLVKAQMVKNVVIVPTGSKGGFVGKLLPDPAADREAWLNAGKDAYRTFIRGLLDVTDNRDGEAVVVPDRVVRVDSDDPYLVVAADKGTATFSDIANEISREYGFWLDDAFASGGSAGYDHKAMGITARGAWESVKRHFRELGVNTQTEDFTVVAIGDMSGDVFGNGMLLSEHIRLIAAFDHRDVFLDPNPDAATSFDERRRLFELPSSSWADYDQALISPGGGVYSRSAKSIPVSPQVKQALDIADDVTELSPLELISRILLAPADLLFNGGVGTYVKADSESHSDVGDRANDAIRVNGGQLRVRVVGEGGNLGLTQLGRVEAAENNVRINTDAIDNSAGVGTSDKEVNLKILLNNEVREGQLSLTDRNELLASMTDEVAAQVLRDNYEQNVLLGNSRAYSAVMLPVHTRLIEWLEQRGELDRELEFLPSQAEIEQRTQDGVGLTRPEFAVLVAYAKLALKVDLSQTDLADDPWFALTLAEYFPTAVRERYGSELQTHPLRKEIIVNAVVNSIVNRGGITFVSRAAEETGASAEQIARAFIIARETYGLKSFVAAVEATDNQVTTDVQTGLYLTFRRLLDRASRWFVLNRPDPIDIAAEVARFAEPIETWAYRMGELLQGSDAQRHRDKAAELVAAGLDEKFAERAAGLLASQSLLDVVAVAGPDPAAVEEIARLYFALASELDFSYLMECVNDLPQDDRWGSMARAALRDDLQAVLISLTRAVRESTAADTSPADRIAAWISSGGGSSERALEALAAVREAGDASIATISVALRTLRSLITT